MKSLLRLVFFLTVAQLTLAAAPAAAKEPAVPKDREETVFLFQNRKVSILVPEGLGYSATKDDNGLLKVRLADPKNQLSVDIVFVPVAPDRFASARDRREFIAENFRGQVASSTEKAMQFEELDPKVGKATYCVFTDSSLIGKPRPSPDEFLHLVGGVKTWPGVIAVFTVLCQDLGSKEYAAALKLLRESVHEKPAPLL